jgi:hypothetical protein
MSLPTKACRGTAGPVPVLSRQRAYRLLSDKGASVPCRSTSHPKRHRLRMRRLLPSILYLPSTANIDMCSCAAHPALAVLSCDDEGHAPFAGQDQVTLEFNPKSLAVPPRRAQSFVGTLTSNCRREGSVLAWISSRSLPAPIPSHHATAIDQRTMRCGSFTGHLAAWSFSVSVATDC